MSIKLEKFESKDRVDLIDALNERVEAIASGDITVNSEIANGSVTTDKIAGGAVTADKLADGVIPDAYTLPTASTETLGGVKVGSGLSIDDGGVLSAEAQEYTLPQATKSTIGGVSVGDNINVNNGKISVPVMTTNIAGVAKCARENFEMSDGYIRLVTTGKGGVLEKNIIDGAVTTNKIKDANVTGTKLADSVAGAGLTKDASGNLAIGDASVTKEMLASDVTDLIGSGSADVPVATIETAGKVKPDGKTINVDEEGLISVPLANSTDVDGNLLPGLIRPSTSTYRGFSYSSENGLLTAHVATTEQFGYVKPDGTTIQINDDGTLGTVGGSGDGTLSTLKLVGSNGVSVSTDENQETTISLLKSSVPNLPCFFDLAFDIFNTGSDNALNFTDISWAMIKVLTPIGALDTTKEIYPDADTEITIPYLCIYGDWTTDDTTYESTLTSTSGNLLLNFRISSPGFVGQLVEYHSNIILDTSITCMQLTADYSGYDTYYLGSAKFPVTCEWPEGANPTTYIDGVISIAIGDLVSAGITAENIETSDLSNVISATMHIFNYF